MSEDQLKKLLEENNAVLFRQLADHFGKNFAAQDEKFTAQDAKLDRIYTLLDRDAKRSETDEQERIALQHQVERHDGWIGQLADATNVKLVPEP